MDLQENIYNKIKKTYEAGRHVVGFGDSSIDVFLEVQSKQYSQILYLIYYDRLRILLMGFIYNIKYNISIEFAENLFPNILLRWQSAYKYTE